MKVQGIDNKQQHFKGYSSTLKYQRQHIFNHCGIKEYEQAKLLDLLIERNKSKITEKTTGKTDTLITGIISPDGIIRKIKIETLPKAQGFVDKLLDKFSILNNIFAKQKYSKEINIKDINYIKDEDFMTAIQDSVNGAKRIFFTEPKKSTNIEKMIKGEYVTAIAN